MTVHELADVRRQRKAERVRPEIASALVALGEQLAGDPEPPTAVFVLTIEADGPHLLTLGHPSWADLVTGSDAFRDGGVARTTEDTSIAEEVRRGYERRQELAQRFEAKRLAHIAEHPWQCEAELCGRRFKTERGRDQHGRTCRHLQAEVEREALRTGLLAD